MNNINSSNRTKNNKKSSSRKNLGYALMLTSLLSLNSPAEAKTWNTVDNSKQSIEMVDDSNILNNIEKRTGIALPSEYSNKLKEFIATNKVMKSYNGARFTENFIVDQMKFNWGISKENQLVFIWSAVYKQITNNDLYDGSDGDDNRLDDFSNVIDNIEQCGGEYVAGFNSYMEKASAEAQQRSTEAQQRSTEAQQRSTEAIEETMKADSLGLREMVKYYNLCIKNPGTNDKNEIENVKRASKDIIQNCKEYGIDYRAILLKEVGDMKKVDAILKFYGVE